MSVRHKFHDPSPSSPFELLPYPPYGSKENRFYTASSNDYILSVIHCCSTLIVCSQEFENQNVYNLPELHLDIALNAHYEWSMS